MRFETFGTTQLFRPSLNTEFAVRHEVEERIRESYTSGIYTNAAVINQIIQRYFGLYDNMLKSLLPRIASLHLMQFVLFQYDQSCEVQQNLARLSNEESERWDALGPFFRRAVKYLAECIAMLAPNVEPNADDSQADEILDRCWICAEQLISLSQGSTQTFALFPNDTVLEIRPRGEVEWFVLEIKNAERYEAFRHRIRSDTSKRSQYIDENATIYDRNRLGRLIDPPFRDRFGISFSEVLSFSLGVNDNTIQPGDGFDVPFVQEKLITNSLETEDLLSASQARVILDGLCLRKSTMQAEGRVVWKPKQEYRALSRPFFEFPHATGQHLVWSRKMADECIFMLFSRLAQKLLPREWQATELAKPLGSYEQEITKLFEDIVIQASIGMGLHASRFKSQIGIGSDKLEIPAEIGEIDLLCYWESQALLVVGDVKLVKPALEPSAYRDDINKFIGKSSNYVDQVKRKAQWIRDNSVAVERSLGSVLGFPKTVTVRNIAPVLVTYYPTFASSFISDCPCVALTELVSDIKRRNVWPYEPVYAA